jgi:exosome complex component RRP40
VPSSSDNGGWQYIPLIDDIVVGIVTERLGENYRVDIGSAASATLPILGFEGASKKSRPQLNVSDCARVAGWSLQLSDYAQRGDLVYARVVVANKDMDPELLCISKRNKSDGFGEIKVCVAVRR